MIDFETLIQSNIAHFGYDRIRIEAKSRYEEALCLFPISQLKQAV